MMGLATMVPEGFVQMSPSCGLHATLGPLYVRSGPPFALGFTVEERHTNPHHGLHGGMIAAVADMAIGYGLRSDPDRPLPAVTITMTLGFLGSAGVGDWVEVNVEAVRRGSRLLYAHCFFDNGGRRIAHATASFMVVVGSSGTSRGTAS